MSLTDQVKAALTEVVIPEGSSIQFEWFANKLDVTIKRGVRLAIEHAVLDALNELEVGEGQDWSRLFFRSSCARQEGATVSVILSFERVHFKKLLVSYIGGGG